MRAPPNANSRGNIFYITTPTSARSVEGTHPANASTDIPALGECDAADAVIRATTRLVRDRTIPPSSLSAGVLARLEWCTFDALRREDYTSAKKTEEAARFLTEHCRSQKAEELRSEETAIIQERLSQARHNLQSRSREWSHIFSVFQTDQGRLRAELLARHRTEELQFAENWSNPAFMISFTKPSQKLISLRKQQKGFALAKDFESASQIKMDADQLRRAETVTAEDRVENSMRLAYETMNERHRRELECFVEHQRKTEIFLRKERMRVIEPIERMISQLEMAQDRDKPLNLNPRASSRNALKPRVSIGRPATRVDPRIIHEYRLADAPEPLPVGAPDVARLIPGIRARAVRRRSVNRG
jgi:hypothetical protein